jgi:hypothetical protein
MQKVISPKSGQASALKRDLADFLRYWEESDLLPSEAAQMLLDFLVGDVRLKELSRKTKHIDHQGGQLVGVIRELASSHP